MASRWDYKVFAYDHAGTIVDSFGVNGAAPGQFLGPRQIAISDGEIFVTDAELTDTGRVQVFDTDGNYLRMWGTPGSGAGQFSSTCGIAVVGNRAYVSEAGGGPRIQIFNKNNGAFIDQFGEAGSGDGQLFGPSCQGDHLSHYGGEIFVADQFNGRVVVFDLDGNWQRNIGSGTLTGPHGVDASTGTVWVADHDANNVTLWTRAGAQVDSFGAAGAGLGTFDGPAGIAVDPSGRTVWVSELGNDRVQVFTTLECAGESLTHVGTSYPDALTTTSGDDVVHLGKGKRCRCARRRR